MTGSFRFAISFLSLIFMFSATAWAAPSSVLINSMSDVITAGHSSNSITVEYDGGGLSMDATSYDTDDITITGANGAATVLSANASGDQVTYTFVPPGGAWDQADNGSYTINLVADQVVDASANGNVAKQLQTFDVNIDTTKPVGSLHSVLPNVVSTGTTPNSFRILYLDGDSGLNLDSIGLSDIEVTGPNGAVTINSFELNVNNANSSYAWYYFSPPGGAWSQADNGEYTVVLSSDEVFDNSNNSVNELTLTTFDVNIDTTKPVASLHLGAVDITAADSNAASIQVTYTDDLSGVDVSSFDINDLVIDDCTVTSVQVDDKTVTYSFLPDDGSWGLNDIGEKNIQIASNQIFDLAGNAVNPASIDSFHINIISETWQNKTIIIDQDLHINSGHELLITDGTTLDILETDVSNGGYFLDQVEFTVSGLIRFIGADNQVTPQGLWRGFTVLTGGELNLGAVNATGNISIGNQGTLKLSDAHINGSLELQSGSVLSIQLENSTSFDQSTITDAVIINGSLDLAASEFSISQEGSEIIIINNDGDDAIQGTFTDLPEGALISQNDINFKVSYIGGDGNDLTLSIDCGLGNFSAIGGCQPCPTGYQCFDNTSRVTCGVGTYADVTGLQQCKLADPGYAVAVNEATEQTPCNQGYYQDQYAQQTCLLAPEGGYTSGSASTGFEMCLAGSYQPEQGQSECLPAPAGSYVDEFGARDFKTCEQGTHSNSGALSDTDCFDVAILVMDKNNIALGAHQYAQTSLEILTLSNEGKADLELTIEFEPNDSAFDLLLARTASSCQSLSPVLATGESCTLDIQYVAEQAGYDEQQLVFTSNGITAIDNVIISASTEIPVIALSASQLDFSGAGEKSITLINQGVTPLHLDSIANSDALNEPFYLIEDTCSNTSLQANQSCAITVRFTTDILQAMAPLGLFIIMTLLIKSNIRRLYKALLVTSMLILLVACGSDTNTGPVEFNDSFNISSNDPVNPSLLVSLTATETEEVLED